MTINFDDKKNLKTDKNRIAAAETDYLYIQTSQILNSGNGLFTAIPIYKDEIIALFKGEILTDKQSKQKVKLGLDDYFMNLPNGKILDCKNTDCMAKFANDANGKSISGLKNNCKITLDDVSNVCLIATRKIKVGEEIFCSYGNRYWKKRF